MTGCTVFALLLMIDNNVPIDRRDVLAVFGFAKACCPQCQPVPSLSLIQLDWLATLYRAPITGDTDSVAAASAATIDATADHLVALPVYLSPEQTMTSLKV